MLGEKKSVTALIFTFYNFKMRLCTTAPNFAVSK